MPEGSAAVECQVSGWASCHRFALCVLQEPMDNILITTVGTAEELCGATMTRIDRQLAQGDVKLVLIDSIGAIFRADYGLIPSINFNTLYF